MAVGSSSMKEDDDLDEFNGYGLNSGEITTTPHKSDRSLHDSDNEDPARQLGMSMPASQKKGGYSYIPDRLDGLIDLEKQVRWLALLAYDCCVRIFLPLLL